jgi:hypothetical protein
MQIKKKIVVEGMVAVIAVIVVVVVEIAVII